MVKSETSESSKRSRNSNSESESENSGEGSISSEMSSKISSLKKTHKQHKRISKNRKSVDNSADEQIGSKNSESEENVRVDFSEAFEEVCEESEESSEENSEENEGPNFDPSEIQSDNVGSESESSVNTMELKLKNYKNFDFLNEGVSDRQLMVILVTEVVKLREMMEVLCFKEKTPLTVPKTKKRSREVPSEMEPEESEYSNQTSQKEFKPSIADSLLVPATINNSISESIYLAASLSAFPPLASLETKITEPAIFVEPSAILIEPSVLIEQEVKLEVEIPQKEIKRNGRKKLIEVVPLECDN